jgi:pyridoxine 5-phosphate synthase
MAGLVVKLDPVARLRKNQPKPSPDPVSAALTAELGGACAVAVHLSGDRRHIQDRDVRLLRQTVQTRLYLEIAATSEMIGFALDIKPDLVTLVSETGEHAPDGSELDLILHAEEIADVVETLRSSAIPVNLLIEPDPHQIKLAHKTHARAVEFHCRRYSRAETAAKEELAFSRMVDAVKLARRLDFDIKAGCGLDYNNIRRFRDLGDIHEFVVGHAVVARAVLSGMQTAVHDMLELVRPL